MAYVYSHIRLDTNEVFYIGIGKNDNYKRASYRHHRTLHWNNIIKKCGWSVIIVFDNLTWLDACQKEKELIKKYGRIDLGTGCLVNFTGGGEGALGIKWSKETNQKRVESRRKNGTLTRTEETKIKISKSMIDKNNKKVIDVETGIIYKSVTEAAEKLNINRVTLTDYLSGKIKNKRQLCYLTTYEAQQ